MTIKHLLLSLALASPALAEDVTMIAPVFSQIVAAPLPDGFAVVFENAVPQSYIMEAVPKGETATAWSQMVTLTGAKGQSAPGSALGFANRLADGYRQACPDHFVARALDAPAVPGATEVFAAFLGCAAIPGAQPEAMVVLVMAGKQDVYTLQWAVRAEAAQGPVPYDLADWTPRLTHLATHARICAIVPGEAPPYPSCLGK